MWQHAYRRRSSKLDSPEMCRVPYKRHVYEVTARHMSQNETERLENAIMQDVQQEEKKEQTPKEVLTMLPIDIYVRLMLMLSADS